MRLEEPNINKPENDEDSMSRRAFLKKAAIAGGILAAGAAGFINILEQGDISKQNDKLEEKFCEAKIVAMSAKKIPNFSGKMNMYDMLPIYEMTLDINGKQTELQISKEQFDSHKSGDVVAISYKEKEDGKIVSIKLK